MELRVFPQYLNGEKYLPVVWWMDGRRRPDLISENQLDRYRRLGYTIEDHETGFKLIYK